MSTMVDGDGDDDGGEAQQQYASASVRLFT